MSTWLNTLTAQYGRRRSPGPRRSGGWTVFDNSGAIEAVRYGLDDPMRGTGTLRIRFKRKPSVKPSIAPPSSLTSTYEYSGVPEDIYLGLVGSESPGSYFASDIKGRFDTRRLSEEELKEE
jgi:hypothetical protein